MRTVGAGGKMARGFWVVAALAALSSGSDGGCCGSGSGSSEAPDGSTGVAVDTASSGADTASPAVDSAAVERDGLAIGADARADAPGGAPANLVLDTPRSFELGRHCGRTVVYFDGPHSSTYAIDVTGAGKVHATSSTLNMMNASVYCTYTLPAGTKNFVLHRGVANIKMDPTNMFPSTNGGGLGFLSYLGANTPRDGTTWG